MEVNKQPQAPAGLYLGKSPRLALKGRLVECGFSMKVMGKMEVSEWARVAGGEQVGQEWKE